MLWKTTNQKGKAVCLMIARVKELGAKANYGYTAVSERKNNGTHIKP